LKTLEKFIPILLVLNLLSSCIFSQGSTFAVATVNSSASANIIEPGSITSDLGNGFLMIAGTVELTPIRTHGRSGSLTLPVTSGSITVAFFNVSGSPGYTFTINIPASPLTVHNGPSTMKVTSFRSEPALNAGPDMIAGVYVSVTPMDITVNYN
jgi:hypothetical protein